MIHVRVSLGEHAQWYWDLGIFSVFFCILCIFYVICNSTELFCVHGSCTGPYDKETINNEWITCKNEVLWQFQPFQWMSIKSFWPCWFVEMSPTFEVLTLFQPPLSLFIRMWTKSLHLEKCWAIAIQRKACSSHVCVTYRPHLWLHQRGGVTSCTGAGAGATPPPLVALLPPPAPPRGD